MSAETPKNKPFRAIAGVTAISLTVGLVAALMPGCYGRQCDATTIPFGNATTLDAGPDGSPNIGEFITPTEWESSPFDGPWINFQHEETIDFVYDDPYDPTRVAYNVTPFISAAPSPNESNDNYTIASGNVAKQFQVRHGSFILFNDTCADYYVRVVLDLPPPVAPDASSSVVDGGVEAGVTSVTSATSHVSDHSK